MDTYEIYVYDGDKLHVLQEKYEGDICGNCSLTNTKFCTDYAAGKGVEAICRNKDQDRLMIFKEVRHEN